VPACATPRSDAATLQHCNTATWTYMGPRAHKTCSGRMRVVRSTYCAQKRLRTEETSHGSQNNHSILRISPCPVHCWLHHWLRPHRTPRMGCRHIDTEESRLGAVVQPSTGVVRATGATWGRRELERRAGVLPGEVGSRAPQLCGDACALLQGRNCLHTRQEAHLCGLAASWTLMCPRIRRRPNQHDCERASGGKTAQEPLTAHHTTPFCCFVRSGAPLCGSVSIPLRDR
jgi:hypothetical protein